MPESMPEPMTDSMTDPSRSRSRTASGMPAELRAILGRPPLLRSESREAYEALTAHCAATLAPRDMVEWLMVADYVDLSWEILRLRRMKQEIVKVAVPGAVYTTVMAFSETTLAGPAQRTAWLQGGAARQELCDELARHDVDEGTFEAEALREQLDTVDKIERFLFQKEALRRAVLRDIDAYRARAFDADTPVVADAPALVPPAGAATGAA